MEKYVSLIILLINFMNGSNVILCGSVPHYHIPQLCGKDGDMNDEKR
jgi:hypothetical protein